MDANLDANEGNYWYNVNTHEVEVGPQSDWTQLIGPYATRADAEAALAKVKANNEAWDEDEES
ncbi:SPOR domain-containing protein [Galactobacter valiniphilus]|uniref:SPOR domain-containing protein n=1 Tax=Galactobacter valiniphilus TaxID=2676122 RepID=A0A399JEI8_9MICC|nr:SPOR domain-containing protein [Galactobacter valiniphilus]RII42977.1 SPOR domain-containing protein [Galactobacter valiniphilus]